MKARLPQGYGGGQANLMKQVQKMQEDMAALQEELDNRDFTITAGGGMITVVMNGKKALKSIELSPDIVDPDDIETLQDLIVAAVNEATTQIDATVSEEMGKITGGMNIPGLF
ncbi:YbaB/EbfC family nucleoid-associated protein [Feifania hominis]|uniref:Nucleoid-associated protein H8695_04805 n=1 Tax=Feifania hominis TaxID=2763660 RepID=A0A926DDB0_9FIRM|nr:YbaB/EbfC family nucleoid-associated protein [Feifania hominis]MBC8536008.1 YbaB/EbfC family nucleoid-associated protein [Feifania hominis]